MSEQQGRDRRNGSASGVGRAAVDRLFDRLPPHSLEAEMSLLGSMILDPQMIADVLPLVSSPEMFYSEAHAAIFRAIIGLYEHHQAGDLVQLVERLRDADQLKDVGGDEYLERLAESVPAATSAPYYAKIVADKHRLRSLIEASGRILYDAYHPGEGQHAVSEVLDKAESRIFAITQSSQVEEEKPLQTLVHEEMTRLEQIAGKGISGLSTGYWDLDELLTGLHEGEMIILAARPSMGKTALALNITEQLAAGGVAPGGATRGETVPVGLFSLEMSKSAVTSRMLSARSGVDSHKMRSGRFSDIDFRHLMQAVYELEKLPIYIDDTPSLSIHSLRARARRMKSKYGIGCVVVDYLQLLTAPQSSRESRQVEVSEISRGIKALARELKVPVVCLAQLNRGPEQRDGKQPRISDLRESGSIEQDADVVMLLHREEYYHLNDEDWALNNPEKAGLAELIIAKQRNGPTDVVRLTWDRATTRFKNHADSRPPSGVPRFNTPERASGIEPKPTPGLQGGFGRRPQTGPVENHRDGGGPARFEDDSEGFESDDAAPF